MSIKDGLNWLKKQAAGLGEQGSFPISPAHTLNYSAPTTVEPNIDLGLDLPPADGGEMSFDASQFGRPAIMDKLEDAAASGGRGAAAQIQNLMQPKPAPAPISDHIPYTGGNPAIDPAVANQGIVTNDTGMGRSSTEAMPTPTPTLPTTAATMADGPEMPSVTTTFPEWQDKPAPTPALPTTAATMADGPEMPSVSTTFPEWQDRPAPAPQQPAPQQPAPQQPEPQQPASQQPATQQPAPAQSSPVVDPAVAGQGYVSENAGNSTAQTQAMPNGSADYSRIFGKGFNASSGSASDKWLAGQADKLRTAGYSDNQISTMLDQNAWRKYGRNGQDYQVNTSKYTKPMGMKSASAADALWAKQAGLNDDLDDLYVRRLRVGLWDKYNG
ncbi:MAG: hypothetical protein MJZ17_05185 [Bacteroidales bacterium]|nr:hypothetical protein [Bacteroidales bacterium]